MFNLDFYFWIKLTHLLGAIVLIGTGVGIAFFMLMAFLSKNVTHIYFTTRTVVLADWVFTTPAVVLQLCTGLWLMRTVKYSFSSIWLYVVLGMFIVIGMCWLPVVWIQIQLKNITQQAYINQTPLPIRFYQLMRLWIVLGVGAFTLILLLIYLMVFKPLAMY